MSALDDYTPGRLLNPLAAARAQHARGRRVIGYLSDDVPVELILAGDALPVRLEAAMGLSTPLADRYLESSFGPAYRSYLEQWLRGELDFLAAVIFPRSNDSAQRLYYYVCELQRRGVCKGPTPLIYDVARIARETSRDHTVAATASLASALGTALPNLEAATRRLRQRVAFARRLAALRVGTTALVGSDAMQAWRALQLDWTEQFEHTVDKWSAVAARRASTKRFIIAGSTPPDDRLHRAIEVGGGNVVDEFFDGSLAQCASRWSGSGSSIEAIADGYHKARATAAQWLHAPDVLVDRTHAAQAHGVVLWLIEEDEGIVWEIPGQVQRLQAAGISVLALTRQSWDADANVLTRISEFAQHGAPQ
jgi:benzoyl-CoA reductase/2-hydroxyglutaryl-CoA dehydratase subunit BcrC/BadD/HgdB